MNRKYHLKRLEFGCILIVKQFGEDFTAPTNGHFIFPCFLGLALTYRSVDEPAEFTGLKLPGRAAFLSAFGTIFHSPTRFGWLMTIFPEPGKKKEYLSLNMGRHGTPTLFIAVNGFDRDAKKFRQTFLGFVQFLPGFKEFFTSHFHY